MSNLCLIQHISKALEPKWISHESVSDWGTGSVSLKAGEILLFYGTGKTK